MKMKFLTKSVFILNDGNEKGLTTGGIISENETILIGCDDRLTPKIISDLNLPKVTAIICCDYRRSANAGLHNFEKAKKYVNENFFGLLSHPEHWWEDDNNRWHIYKLRPDNDILRQGVDNICRLTDNEEIKIGDKIIKALLTPGDTDFSMSFLVEDEDLKIIFCGGLLYKGGKIPFLYRLTQGIGDQSIGDYHGYLRGIPVWKKSLELISYGDLLVPYLGGVIENPKSDINVFCKNIDEYYNKYTDISSMNYYFKGALDVNNDTKMTESQEKDFPPYVKNIGGQCVVIISKNKNAIALDCGGINVTDTLLSMIKRGEIISVDALYITHYHDDHVDGCEYFRSHFECPIYADRIQADILRNPMNYRLPCISPVSVDVTALDDGYSWKWQDFELTSFSFPGQTLYHGGLLVKNSDETLFFVGDSFSSTGIDDYCAYNRTLLIPGEGYFKCINLLKKYMPNYLINQHIMTAFDFTVEQLNYMEKNLMERIKILEKLSVWSNINYALDEYFVMPYPYEQTENNAVDFLVSDYAENISCEIVPSKQIKSKNIQGIRVYIGDIYLGQKSCCIINSDSIFWRQRR